MAKNFKSKSLALIAALAMTAQGCYGKFALTRWVYDFNGSVTNNGFVHSIVMWALYIIPVYGIAGLVDLIIFNPIEVLTGDNPIKLGNAPKVNVSQNADGSVEYTAADATVKLTPISARHIEVSKDGEVVGVATMSEQGELIVSDAEGAILRTFTTAEVQQMAVAN